MKNKKSLVEKIKKLETREASLNVGRLTIIQKRGYHGKDIQQGIPNPYNRSGEKEPNLYARIV